MRIANLAGRLTVLDPDGLAVDVETASGQQFSANIQEIYSRWDEFRDWANSADLPAGIAVREGDLGAPSPLPPQVFAIGLNYREHAVESGLDIPERPFVFTKFPSSVTGPFDTVRLPKGSVDFEAELVAVIGRQAREVNAVDAWSHVAGLTMGQDLSERELQLSGPAPQQFNLGKSHPGFAPVGPVLVTPDEFDDPDAIEISCSLSGELMQKTRTDDMIFSISAIVEYLSHVVTLLPGDLIFTGTPSGIGWSRDPRRLIGPGDELVSSAAGIGEMRHLFR